MSLLLCSMLQACLPLCLCLHWELQQGSTHNVEIIHLRIYCLSAEQVLTMVSQPQIYSITANQITTNISGYMVRYHVYCINKWWTRFFWKRQAYSRYYVKTSIMHDVFRPILGFISWWLGDGSLSHNSYNCVCNVMIDCKWWHHSLQWNRKPHDLWQTLLCTYGNESTASHLYSGCSWSPTLHHCAIHSGTGCKTEGRSHVCCTTLNRTDTCEVGSIVKFSTLNSGGRITTG